jgi:hypothetical protein
LQKSEQFIAELIECKLISKEDKDKIARYSYFERNGDVVDRTGAWIGIHFRLWKKHGLTPLWAVFHNDEWGHDRIAQEAIEPWVLHQGILATTDEDGLVYWTMGEPIEKRPS